MMVFSMLDKKAGMHGAPMLAMNEAHMGRFLEERFRGSDETVARYPEDFDLYFVADFDEMTGRLTVPEQPRFVVNMGIILQPRSV